MIESMYRVEMTPIDQTETKTGGRSTSFPISGRVLEAYRGSHVGNFWQGGDGKLHIAVYIREGSSDRVVDADRLNPVIHEIWKEYFDSLRTWQKLVRMLFSHRAWVAAFIVSVIASAMVLSIDKVWITRPERATPVETSGEALPIVNIKQAVHDHAGM